MLYRTYLDSIYGDSKKKIYICVCWTISVYRYEIYSAYFTNKLPTRLNPFPNKPWFLCVCSKRLLKTPWEKEKLLATSNFSSSHSVFYTSGKLSSIFIKLKIIVCKPFEFGKVYISRLGKG